MSNNTPDTTAMSIALDEATIGAFADSLQGGVTCPGDPTYDSARRVWNGMIDKRPAIIAHCAGVADVVACVNFARENNLALAVRGGGHNVAGHATCDGGLVVDLSPMKAITVDPAARVAHAQGGATLGDLDRATQAHGLATPLGVVSATGIAGLTLGGGLGWLKNTYGLSCDNLISAEVVTADGRVLTASASENSDLFWAIRGGGGNFGIVTTFEYRLHPVGPEVMFTFVFHDGERMAEALRFYRDYVATAPDEVNSLAFCGQIPASEHFPAEIHGRPFIVLGAMYAGPVADGERVLQPLRDFGTPLLDFSGPTQYVAAQSIFDADYPAGMRYYWKSLNLTSLSDEAIDVIATHARRQPSPLSTVDLWHVGGQMRRVGADESAFNGRQAAFVVNLEANWTDSADDAANIAWARDLIAALQPFSDGSRYLNFPGFQEEGDTMMREAFGPQYTRLAQIKAKYDPTNLFRLNQNIKPERNETQRRKDAK
ncbi:MAG: FAD-binding oxidoreductase [Anaerolineae bacterium]